MKVAGSQDRQTTNILNYQFSRRSQHVGRVGINQQNGFRVKESNAKSFIEEFTEVKDTSIEIWEAVHVKKGSGLCGRT